MTTKLLEHLRKTVRAGCIECLQLPDCPEISLYLINQDYPRGRLPEDEMLAIMNSPAYWAFCWASGRVLSRYILDNPLMVKDRTVIDFGAGSGVVAVAAAKAGAARVIACDIDSASIDAITANAALNGVQIEATREMPISEQDLIIAADVLYDRDNLHLLEDFRSRAQEVLLADSRIRDLQAPGYDIVARCESRTVPDLDEYNEFNQVRIYRARRGC